MFQILPFDVRICKLMHYYLGTASERCDESPGWGYSPRAKWSQLSSFGFRCSQCPSVLFPLAFWAVVGISLCGTFFSLSELINIWGCCRKPISIWRERRLYVLSYPILRRFRIAGAAVMLTAWILLTVGLLNVRPRAMLPWLCITSTVLTLDFCLWCSDVFSGRIIIDYATLLIFSKSMAVLFLVCSVKSTLDSAVASQTDDAFRFL